MKRVRIDVITGFLGAGKTTLIRRLLESGACARERWAVVENEFGRVGIDGAFLAGDGNLSIVEIPNGCLCCTLKGDFTAAIERLIRNHVPDRILIEPSGILVLEDLAALLREPPLSDLCMLASVTTVVDAAHFLSHRSRYARFLESQIRGATLLAASKLEQIAAPDRQELLASLRPALREMNADAPLLAEVWSETAPERFLEEMDRRPIGKAASPLPPESASDSPLPPESASDSPLHDSLDTLGLDPVRDLDETVWRAFLSALLAGTYGEVLRMKGFIRIDGRLRRVNLAHGTLEELHETESDETPKIGFVGRNLLKKPIRRVLAP